ncbi:MAG: DNA polymerase III subunit beta [Bacteroidales bacterium]|nr:DNA polymerase III subunit beta [Bacteroidales bacterium]
MKFIVSSSLLLRQLQAISGVLGSNNTLPILDNFLFDLQGDELVLKASDLETTMTSRLSLEMSEGSGLVAIPAKMLIETLKTFSDIPVTFMVDETNFGIELSAGEGKYRLAGQDGNDFPKIPAIESNATISIQSEALVTAISKTIFAAANDELRPNMSGIFCELNEDNITFVATDAHKLVRYRRTDIKSNSSASFILPKKPLNQLKNILSHDDVPVTMDFNQTNAHFAYKNFTMTCRLVEGKYPNYEAVIPVENPNKLIVERSSFLNAIRRVSIFSNQSTYQVKFKIAGQELILNAEDLDYSNEARERISCQYEGEDLEIGFNSKFLVEMLNNLGTDDVLMEMSQPNRAGLVLPANNENPDEHILMLVMPVMLNN